MNKIWLTEGLSLEQKKRAVEQSLIMGFYSTSAKFPIASKESGMKIADNLSHLKEIFKIESAKWPEEYVSASKSAKPLPEFDWRKKKGLESIFSKGMLLKDLNYDQLPDKLDFKIIIPKDCDLSVLTAACNFAFRFGMETTAFEGPIVADDDWNGNRLIFENDNECGMELIGSNENINVRIFGQGEELEKFSSDICECFSIQPEGRTWTNNLQDITESFAMKNLDGQLAYLKTYWQELKGNITAYVSPKINEKLSKVQPLFPEVEFMNHKDLKKIYEKSYDITWEMDVLKNILEEKVYKRLKPEDKVEIYGAVSEDINVRRQLSLDVEKELRKRNVISDRIQILRSYKQGISWIDEVILPQLAGKDINKIIIKFKPFLPDGVKEWIEENGATPTYNNVNTDNPDKWFDIPIRFLQELYPVDDIIADKLQIHRNKVEFVKYDGEDDLTYEIEAYGEKDNVIFRDFYKAVYSERPYIDDLPKMGKVHPSTGYLKVVVNGEEIVNENVVTDVENIWNIYQQEVLPDCRKFIEEKTGNNINIEAQPFFAKLHLEITASEPDYQLPFREDLISTLDGLHEDMYFVGLDYFKNYGIEKANIILDAPGLILPDITTGKGKPTFKVTLYDELEKNPCIKSYNRIIVSEFKREHVELYIQKLSQRNGKITAFLNTNINNEKLIDSFTYLLNNQVLEISNSFSGINEIIILSNDTHFEAQIAEHKEQDKTLDILDIDLMENTLIGYDQYINIIRQLKSVPGIEVYKIAESYLGRDIYAIEILPELEGYVSRVKRINNLPSEIINSRHHANEVSSTNAAFILLKKILTDSKYKNLAEKLNLVIVPMENVDGTAIHYELQKNNPKWKLHVARFNAIGKEFYYEHFDMNTIHTEALGLTRLWEKFLPDLIIDNHGVPTHEWEQQFSGYTSPSYKGFWLPRSLLYGYYWLVSDEVYKSNFTVNKKIEEVIADAISKETEITKWNKEWMTRFEKYAHEWMPKQFPANYYKDMINYWIPFNHESNHRYPSIRFPWITTVAYTSEVADETAQDDYLNLCARAHVTHDEAIINMLMNCTCLYESKCLISENEISISSIRQRPIIV
ncbi:M14 family metallopeptidase [Sedimentibacter sp.]|uniref:M14 family metallopeptidase n=1 Tax=Sedimentibacter sp. TaxID=1960295 RepID=UPI0028A8D057|nr:M14 family metallopeptidase [Sedimentibacter sp.]